jgi:coenzyme F420-reducing hydrogenase delta subunit
MKLEEKTTARLAGFLCEKGAYTFFDLSSSVPRKLPRHFMALPVASIAQIKIDDVLKAFFAGAAGVLLAGCEICRNESQQQIEIQFAEIAETLGRYGIEPQRLRLEWISAGEEKKFIQLVNEMTEYWNRQPPLRLHAGIKQTLSHCG